MPISLNEQKNNKSALFKIIMIALIVLVFGVGVYYVFFAPTPAFEVIAPPPLQTAREISKKSVDPTNVINSQAFRNLRNYAPLPTIGLIGRANPFLAF